MMPRLFRGAYGIGSRDFRPEHILGAYEYAIGQIQRTDGKAAPRWDKDNPGTFADARPYR